MSLLLKVFSQLLNVLSALVSLILKVVDLLLSLLEVHLLLLLLDRIVADEWTSRMRCITSIGVFVPCLLELVVDPLVLTFLLLDLLSQFDDVVDQLDVHVHDAEVVFLVNRSLHL